MTKNLFVIFFIAFLNSLTASIVIPILYVYAERFGMNDFAIAVLFASFPLAQFLAGPYIGTLSDRFGRKPLLIVSLLGTAASNFLSAIAGTGWILLLSRLLDGATGGNISVAKAVISDQVEPKNRAKAFGVFGAMFGVGFMFGPIISLAVQQISLEAVYVVSTLMALFATLMTATLLKETHSFDEEDENIFTKRKNFFFDTISAIFDKKIGLFIATEFFVSLGFFMIVFAFQPFILNQLGGSQEDITRVLIVIGTVSFLVQGFLARFIYSRFGLFVSLVFSLLGQIILYVAFAFVGDVFTYILLAGVWSFANSLYRPIISSFIANLSDKKTQGKNMGYNEAYFGLGNFLGPIVGSIVLTIFSSYAAPYLLGAWIVSCVLIFIYLKREQFVEVAKI